MIIRASAGFLPAIPNTNPCLAKFLSRPTTWSLTRFEKQGPTAVRARSLERPSLEQSTSLVSFNSL